MERKGTSNSWPEQDLVLQPGYARTHPESLMWLLPLLACTAAHDDPEPAPADTTRAPGELPQHADALPFALDREMVGDPIADAEIDDATKQLIEVLEATRYFETVADRVHAAPRDEDGLDPATWWSGVTVTRENGVVAFTHTENGADNNGLRTAPLLEGACYAYALSGDPAAEALVDRLLRGFVSWSEAMERGPDDEVGILARAAYTEPFTMDVGDVTLSVDTSPARPGVDVEPAQFVHLPDNPRFGDVWVRNTRSKDDLGHMLRALGEVDRCDAILADRADLVEARRRAIQWSSRIVAEDFQIPTLDPDLQEVIPEGDLAMFFEEIECGARLAVNLAATEAPVDGEDCEDGLQVPENTVLSSGALQIVRHFHLGAAQQALVHGQNEVAEQLAYGLSERLDVVHEAIDAGEPHDNFNDGDLVAYTLHAVAAGVPLTPREVRWLHGRLAATWASATAADPATFALFDAGTPDGEYVYEPGLSGTSFIEVGLWLAPCAAKYRDPAGTPVLDCDRIEAALGG